MTFWDFFHTHPIQAWIFIVLAIVVIHMVVSDVVKVFTFEKRVSKLENTANKLTRVH